LVYDRFLNFNELPAVTEDIVEAARSTLAAGKMLNRNNRAEQH
jgi:hypothetical protein